jgi:hypothetical protein
MEKSNLRSYATASSCHNPFAQNNVSNALRVPRAPIKTVRKNALMIRAARMAPRESNPHRENQIRISVQLPPYAEAHL